MKPLQPRERLIVALDVPTLGEAVRLVEQLSDVVSFYKVGLELLMSGAIGDLLQRLAVGRNNVFVDLKLPSDIPTTVRNVVRVAAGMGVKLLTLSHSASRATICAAREGRGDRPDPRLLFVPALSSLDKDDFAAQTGQDASEFGGDLVKRATEAQSAGADGFIVSGNEIGLFRSTFPDATLVSPGIRPAWAPPDDHKRSCTPAEATRLGADYLVVGRPIRNAPNPREATQRIIDEIASAASEPHARSRQSDRPAGGEASGSHGI